MEKTKCIQQLMIDNQNEVYVVHNITFKKHKTKKSIN